LRVRGVCQKHVRRSWGKRVYRPEDIAKRVGGFGINLKNPKRNTPGVTFNQERDGGTNQIEGPELESSLIDTQRDGLGLAICRGTVGTQARKPNLWSGRGEDCGRGDEEAWRLSRVRQFSGRGCRMKRGGASQAEEGRKKEQTVSGGKVD